MRESDYYKKHNWQSSYGQVAIFLKDVLAIYFTYHPKNYAKG